jgi:D-alanine-D-alanine ligase
MNINAGVFFGGSSVEHEVSIISALQGIHALDKEKYNPIPIYITKDGEMYTGKELLKIENYKHITKLLKLCIKITLVREGGDVWLYRISSSVFKNKLTKIDIAFPIVHGTNCEDGSLQGYFEVLRLPYVGSDVLSSAVGMDKIMMKHVLRRQGLPIVDDISFHVRDWYKESEKLIEKIETILQYPVIIKPANLGSSVGIGKANSKDELELGIELAGSFADRIIIEKGIENLKEINCAVLGDSEYAEASALEEPISSEEILSYSDKYVSKDAGKGMNFSKRKLPAELPQAMESEIKKLALETFKAIGCNGCARVDFLIDEKNNNKVYVNEINTIPGSLSFYLWEAEGKSFSKLLDEMIHLAFKRDRERAALLFTYNANILAMGGWKGGKGAKSFKS